MASVLYICTLFTRVNISLLTLTFMRKSFLLMLAAMAAMHMTAAPVDQAQAMRTANFNMVKPVISSGK